MSFQRRDFLKSIALGTLASAASSLHQPAYANKKENRSRYLILIELSGGNDSLNTIIPLNNALYRQYRPSIAIPEKDIIPMTDHYGVHPSLKSMLELYKNSELAIINGVGTSHKFDHHYEAIQAWDSGSDEGIFVADGWMSDLQISESSHRDYVVDRIVFGDYDGPLQSRSQQILQLDSIDQYLADLENGPVVPIAQDNDNLSNIYQLDKGQKPHKIRRLKNLPPPEQFDSMPDTDFGWQMRDVARLIIGRAAAPVIKVTLEGFDTHQFQMEQHAAVLQELSDTIMAFRNIIHEAGMWDQVLVATYSEFGRSLKENNFAGTEHGTSGSMFVIGRGVVRGMHGSYPSLDRLQDGELRTTVDFRRYLNSLVWQWFGQGSLRLSMHRHPPFNLIDVGYRHKDTPKFDFK